MNVHKLVVNDIYSASITSEVKANAVKISHRYGEEAR